MAVGIYLEPNPLSKFSQSREFVNPFSLTFDGRVGGTKQVRLYVRNDEPLFYYTDLTIGLLDSNDIDIIDRPEDGFVWKLSAGDVQPTQAQWANLPAANTISLPNIGAFGSPDTSTYLPFWVNVRVPPGLNIRTFDGVQFVLRGEENLVS